MAPVLELLSRNNPVFSAYAFYTAILVAKMLVMSLLTARQRFRKRVFANPEDTSFKGKVKFDDPDVERVRRAHQNDLENILPFVIVGFLYVLTDPSRFLALNLFRLFTAARLSYSFVYALLVVPQPSRFFFCLVGYFITSYMTLQVVFDFL